MRPDWQATLAGIMLIAALIGVGMLLGVAVARWSPEPPVVDCTPTPYIQVIERDVVRCEPGMTLQVSADAEGYLIAWCE